MNSHVSQETASSKLAMSRRRRIPMHELAVFAGSDSDEDQSDEEEGNGNRPEIASRGRGGAVAECRGQSDSEWFHFPHVEMTFLFAAFEGAVASQASAITHTGCSPTFYMGLFSLVSYCFHTVRICIYTANREVPPASFIHGVSRPKCRYTKEDNI